MKTTITKKPIVKKVKVLGAKSDKDIRRQQSEDAIPKSSLKKDVLKKDNLETKIKIEKVEIPRVDSIQDIKKDDLGLSYSSINEKDLSGVNVAADTVSSGEEEAIPAVSGSNEEIKQKETEEILQSSVRETPYVNYEEKNKKSFYILVVVVTLLVVTVFGIYKMFFSSQKNGDIVAQVVNQEVVVPVAEVVVPVEKITIADPTVSASSKKENITTVANVKTLKESSAFKSFTYDAGTGKQISLSSTCHDKYYAFLIFDSKIDYRKDPGQALSNKAFVCPASGHFTVDINLKDINLQNGTYYLFVADQGATGSWYNPR